MVSRHNAGDGHRTPAAYLGFGLSLTIFLFHGFIKGIPYELEEAGTIDGCSRFQVFYLVVFPLLSPIHATVVVLNGMWIWNDYLLPLLVLGKGNAVQTIPLAVANFAGAYVKQWDLILTAIVMAIIPIIVLFLAAQRFIIKGIVAGSIK
jgi:raffinose/stachyose/melibiose transport system permease protein